jgi:hypothetical protein
MSVLVGRTGVAKNTRSAYNYRNLCFHANMHVVVVVVVALPIRRRAQMG